MGKNINIPKSYYYYLNNKSALTILDAQKAPPPTFKLDDVLKFNQANASLQICKYQFYVMMAALFENTWGKAVMNSSVRTLSIYEFNDPDYTPVSINSIWENAYFSWYYEYTNKCRLWLGCTVENNPKKFSLCGAVKDRENNWTSVNELGLDPRIWRQDADDEAEFCLVKSAQLHLKSEQTSVNVDSLCKMAAQAIKDIVRFCNE